MGRIRSDLILKVITGTDRLDRENNAIPKFDLIDDFLEAPLHLNMILN